MELGTTILGAFKPLPFLRVGKIGYQSTFTFFAYTDGLTETFNDQGEPFELERVQAVVEENNHQDLDKINGILLRRLNEFRGRNTYTDDITLLSCRVG